MQVAMIGVLEQIRKKGLKDVKFCGQVHDEILLDVHKKDLDIVLEIVYSEMVNVKERFNSLFNYIIEVPMNVDVELGYNYFDVVAIKDKDKLGE